MHLGNSNNNSNCYFYKGFEISRVSILWLQFMSAAVQILI